METLPGKKGLQIYGWSLMTSHVHMIIGTADKKLDAIVGEMKSFTSTQLKKIIKDHPHESRKECLPAVGRDDVVHGKSRKEKRK